jgi:hypothetical protein
MASNPVRRSASERLGVTLAGGRRSGRRCNQHAVAARRSKPLPTLRFTKLDKVFTYGIMATWVSQFAHLGMAADGGRDWRR